LRGEPQGKQAEVRRKGIIFKSSYISEGNRKNPNGKAQTGLKTPKSGEVAQGEKFPEHLASGAKKKVVGSERT